MPQLDLLIFKYESLNFILSFFLFFFLNQYVIFPSLVRNIVLRRKLITRNLNNDNEIFFSLLLVRNLNFNLFDNVIFSTSVSVLRNNVYSFFRTVTDLFFFFVNLKNNVVLDFLLDFKFKSKVIVWFNFYFFSGLKCLN